jgi:transport and Golgi organization protein 2
MCTAILSLEPGAPVLLAGFRDELTDRAWQPPQRHWPGYPELIGGRDLLAGGTWLAVAPSARRAACVLNARGAMAPARSRRSRGVLPLQAAAEGKLAHAGLADFDPFHLLVTEPGRATLASWDGQDLTERELAAGLHMIVNSGLDSDLLAAGTAGAGAAASAGREHELARTAHFLPRLRAAPRPVPRPGDPVAHAWGDWLPLLDGDGIAPDDPRALIVRRDLGDGRVWGTTSTSLIALWPDAVRYDFTGKPGDAAAWRTVPTA